MKPILEIQNISKKFRIYHENQPYLSLRDSLTSLFKKSKSSSEEFFALKDVCFDVFPSESIGIIGKNGAGKSTLLKVLSKITPPSSGKIVSRGRVASLLEVGTGFHPELSGRENIFLNGSILGMKQKEILSKFDEIVDFSGTERFLDTPLKRYSSGMQLRLAFSVAAFLEPEILVIDEVLAVGDVEFQKKCIGKMEDVSKSGRTILFVSHNMAAIQSLCTNAVYLSEGKVLNYGKSHEIINQYLKDNLSNTNFEKGKTNKITYVKKVNLDSCIQDLIELSVEIYSKEAKKAAIDIRLYTFNGEPAAFGSIGTFDQNKMLTLICGVNTFSLQLTTSSIANGLYYISIDITNPDKEYFDRIEQAIFFEISNSPGGTGSRVLLQEWNYGYYKLPILLKGNEQD